MKLSFRSIFSFNSSRPIVGTSPSMFSPFAYTFLDATMEPEDPIVAVFIFSANKKPGLLRAFGWILLSKLLPARSSCCGFGFHRLAFGVEYLHCPIFGDSLADV